MKFLSVLFAAWAVKVSAHYTLPALIVGGADTDQWQYVRQTNNFESNDPVTDVTIDDIRCYTSTESDTSSTATVTAGSTIGFTVPITLYHPGVLNVYMAQAPAGTDVADWDGSGEVWFRIYQITADTDGGETITFPSQTIHVANVYGGAQFYLSCAQIEVTNGGSGTPGPLVAFPGAYTGNEPGILIDIYYPIPANYTQPGPPLWTGAGGSSPPPVSSTVKTTSTKASTTTTISTTSNKASTTTASSTSVSIPGGSTGTTAAEYGQCGGQGWTGPTVCATPYTCHVLNGYYSQCY
ncbi:glycosyl hydrolase family 61-domain-containing protein [Mycena sanguinolenta]|nr:glycosyl hydrolase family 61-domain-containing protein [Mycena sanguinolenta]